MLYMLKQCTPLYLELCIIVCGIKQTKGHKEKTKHDRTKINESASVIKSILFIFKEQYFLFYSKQQYVLSHHFW